MANTITRESLSQILENNPSIVEITAKSMGLTPRDFLRKVEAGQVTSDVFLLRFIYENPVNP